MESGTLGTSENIDCHMAKNSEYGAALLLTISAYGAGTSTCAGTGKSNSSTGNASGIYQLSGEWEYVAAYYTGASSPTVLSKLVNAADKYVDRYTVDSLEKYNALDEAAKVKGDALYARGFLGSTSASWPNAGSPVFSRGSSSLGFFSYNRNTGSNSGASRAVVVCGAGL